MDLFAELAEPAEEGMTYSGIQIGGSGTGSPWNLAKRLSIVEEYLELRKKKILDCGCGDGSYVLALLDRGADAYGIEYGADMVAQFAQAYPEHARRLSSGNIEHMAIPSASFDIALLNEVLEHVPNETAALDEIHRILKPDGHLIVFAPNRFYPFETHPVQFKHGGARLPLYCPFVPYVPLVFGNLLFKYPARNYWPRQLRRQIQARGFHILNSGYVWQTFENISGQQPRIVARVAPTLRALFRILERVPGIRAFGVSQVILAHRSS